MPEASLRRLKMDRKRLVRMISDYGLFQPDHLDDREAQLVLTAMKRRLASIDEQLALMAAREPSDPKS